jgi:hypothetical protein
MFRHLVIAISAAAILSATASPYVYAQSAPQQQTKSSQKQPAKTSGTTATSGNTIGSRAGCKMAGTC